MSRRLTLASIVVGGLFLGLVCFRAGQHSQETALAALRNGATGARDERRVSSRSGPAFQEGNLLVTGLAEVPSRQAAEILETASPEERTTWLREITAVQPNSKKVAALFAFFRSAALVSPEETIRLFKTLPDPGDQRIAIVTIMHAAAPSSMREMAELLIELPLDIRSPEGADFLVKAIKEWSMLDPAAAAAFLDRHAEKWPAQTAVYLLEHWAQADPAAAAQWLERQNFGAEAVVPLRGLLVGWYHTNPQAAFDYAARHSDEPVFAAAITDVASSAFLAAPREAAAFVQGLKSDEAKSRALEMIAGATATVETAGERHSRPAPQVAEWLGQFPVELRMGAYLELLRRWETEDAAEMSRWLASLTREVRDPLLARYCKEGSQESFRLATVISDPALREETIETVLDNWLPPEPNAAMQVIQESDLSADLKALALQKAQDLRVGP